MATASDASSAIENILHRQIYFISHGSPSCNLDAIGKSAESTVGPTAAAILWNVLIEGFGSIGDAIDRLPGEIGGQLILINVGVGQGGGIIV